MHDQSAVLTVLQEEHAEKADEAAQAAALAAGNGEPYRRFIPSQCTQIHAAESAHFFAPCLGKKRDLDTLMVKGNERMDFIFNIPCYT